MIQFISYVSNSRMQIKYVYEKQCRMQERTRKTPYLIWNLLLESSYISDIPEPACSHKTCSYKKNCFGILISKKNLCVSRKI